MNLCIPSKKIECVALFTWMCIPLMWIYAEHQRMRFTIYLNVYSSAVIHCLFEYIFLCYISIQSIKVSAEIICISSKTLLQYLFKWYNYLLWVYAELQRRCCTIFLNAYSSAVILYRISKKLLHYFFQCVPPSIWIYFTLPW